MLFNLKPNEFQEIMQLLSADEAAHFASVCVTLDQLGEKETLSKHIKSTWALIKTKEYLKTFKPRDKIVIVYNGNRYLGTVYQTSRQSNMITVDFAKPDSYQQAVYGSGGSGKGTFIGNKWYDPQFLEIGVDPEKDRYTPDNTELRLATPAELTLYQQGDVVG